MSETQTKAADAREAAWEASRRKYMDHRDPDGMFVQHEREQFFRGYDAARSANAQPDAVRQAAQAMMSGWSIYAMVQAKESIRLSLNAMKGWDGGTATARVLLSADEALDKAREEILALKAALAAQPQEAPQGEKS